VHSGARGERSTNGAFVVDVQASPDC
jgi:hypothetical protein